MIECIFEGCVKPKTTKGLCNGHYHQQLRGGELKPLRDGKYRRSASPVCFIDGCEGDTRARGFCAKHLRRVYVHGDPSVVKQAILRGPKVRTWDLPSYEMVHYRINKRRGPARQHECWMCLEQAAQWAYDHKCSDEIVENGLKYSKDIDRYRPMCHGCHNRFDRRRRVS